MVGIPGQIVMRDILADKHAFPEKKSLYKFLLYRETGRSADLASSSRMGSVQKPAPDLEIRGILASREKAQPSRYKMGKNQPGIYTPNFI